jgi:hypothetical protein
MLNVVMLSVVAPFWLILWVFFRGFWDEFEYFPALRMVPLEISGLVRTTLDSPLLSANIVGLIKKVL